MRKNATIIDQDRERERINQAVDAVRAETAANSKTGIQAEVSSSGSSSDEAEDNLA